MSSVESSRACVAERTISAKLVYTILKNEGSMALSALIHESGLSRSAVSAGIEHLIDCEVVEECFCLTDARRRAYRLAVSD